MTQSLFASTADAHFKPLSVSFFQIAQLALWSFALVSLCFFVPETGFDYFVGSIESSFVAYPLFWMVSLLPFIVFLEAWGAYRSSALNKWGLGIFVVFTGAITGVVAYGIPAVYFTYLHPAGDSSYLPYLMLGAGAVAWLLLFGASRLLIWKKA